MIKGDIVILTNQALKDDIPGCLSVHPFKGEITKDWTTKDGSRYLDVRNPHKVNYLPHETTYHEDYLEVG